MKDVVTTHILAVRYKPTLSSKDSSCTRCMFLAVIEMPVVNLN